MSASPVELGTMIAGKYRVERVLGQGGMGVVVVAMHDELDQRVAIKFLLPNALEDAEWVKRFSREARAAARIKSEHAVKVYDVGKLETGAPYMVMEYLEGRDLQTTLLERYKLPPSEAVEYLLQACEALAEAHAAGIVHRDMKPANLFVTHRTDGSPCVKILDFGISKVSSLTSGKEQTVTNTRAIVGSPLYMSPEQMRASKNVDARTDIWSLGIILQEMISGMPSFVANTAAELCALVLTAPPTSLRDTLPDAPPGLDAVIAKCLAKNPDERYATVAEFARALEPFGPPSCRTSVERISRLSAGVARAELTSVDGPRMDASASGNVRVVPEHASAISQTEMVSATQATGAPSPSSPVAPAGTGTAAAWGSSSASPRKPRVALWAGGGVAVAVLAIAGFVIASKTGGGAASSAATQAASSPLVPSLVPSVASAVASTSVQPPTSATTSAIDVMALPSATHAAAPVHPTSKPLPVMSTKKTPAGVDTAGFGGRN